ncbi:MAG: sulfotransferase [Gammaproteobacteria bacterium]
MRADCSIFFGTGAGRCGTMALANLLNAEPDVLCCHEGQIRHLEQIGDQHLPYMTLENFQAYRHPERAKATFAAKRREMRALGAHLNLRAIGDIAYNNAPFVHVIPSLFPDARLVVLTRDGRDFVRSAYTRQRPDPTPVGWLDENTELSRIERFVALGRLRPLDSEAPNSEWRRMSVVAKNAWLWAETYRLILDGLVAWDENRVQFVRLEDFRTSPREQYGHVRRFLGLDDAPLPPAVEMLLVQPINRRDESAKVLPDWRAWTAPETEDFWRYAGPMMGRLGYAKDDEASVTA